MAKSRSLAYCQTEKGEVMSCVFCEKITHDDGVTEVGRLGVFYFEPLNPIVPGHLLRLS